MDKFKREFDTGALKVIPYQQKIISRDSSYQEDYKELLIRLEREDWTMEPIFPYLKRVEEQRKEYEFDLIFINEALRRISEIQDISGEEEPFSINVFPRTFLNSRFPTELCELMYKNKIKANFLTLELLERGHSLNEVLCNRTCRCIWNKNPLECGIIHSCLELQETTIQKVWNILVNKVWINLAIDDYPEWNNNASVLQVLEWLYDTVKFDWIFIEELFQNNSPEDFIIKLQNAIDVVKKRNPNLKIVIERVSSEELRTLLDKVEGITHYQWFIFHKPEQL